MYAVIIIIVRKIVIVSAFFKFKIIFWPVIKTHGKESRGQEAGSMQQTSELFTGT